jgi:hypothetical protein
MQVVLFLLYNYLACCKTAAMARYFLFSFCLVLLVSSCSKEGDKKFCWQLIDVQGNTLNKVCNKTEAEMQAQYNNPCSYYKITGEKSCWLVNGTEYYEDLTQEGIHKLVQCFRGGNGTVVKVACGYCQLFYHRVKRTYKPTGSFVVSGVTSERMCGDTVTVLFHGRQVVLKDTPDSLVVRQFSTSGTFN